jgi:hypothetical protein
MYWNPIDSALSGRINDGHLWVVGFFCNAAGGTRVHGIIQDGEIVSGLETGNTRGRKGTRRPHGMVK